MCVLFSGYRESIRHEIGHKDHTANNVCAHIDDLQSVVAAVSLLLADDGVFAFEVSYPLDVLSKTLFDTIYHEHLDYHAISPLIPFFKQHGLTVFNAERVASRGGSIRVFAAPEESGRKPTRALQELLEAEETAQLFSEPIIGLKRKFHALGTVAEDDRRDLRKQGADGRLRCSGEETTTLMHQFGLGRNDMAYIVDDSPWKQGLHSPGINVPIVPASHLTSHPVDDLVVLA